MSDWKWGLGLVFLLVVTFGCLEQPEPPGGNGNGNDLNYTAGLDVSDQNWAGTMRTIFVDRVETNEPAWVAIYEAADIDTNRVLGYAPVSRGVSTDVTVDVNQTPSSDQLIAQLHTDAGQIGVFDFPDADPVIQTDGQPVAVPFNLVRTASNGPLPQIGLEQIAQNLVAPIGLVSDGSDSNRLFIVEQTGFVRILGSDNNVLSTPFLDVSNKIVDLNENYDERGLLGVAFHPQFNDNNKLYVYYTAPLRTGAPQGFDHTNVIAEYSLMANDPNRVDPASERILLQVDHPQFNHSAGQILFGPDGYLYIPIGDGGNEYDRGLGHSSQGNAQDPTNLLGKILRIDVDQNGQTQLPNDVNSMDQNILDEPPLDVNFQADTNNQTIDGNVDENRAYGIPSDNPLVGENGRPEIFAWGLRNPFRISFDPQTGDLYAMDAGQDRYEEINLIENGGNYGWPLKEGFNCTILPDTNQGTDSNVTPTDCDANTGQMLRDPLIEVDHQDFNADALTIISGNVYRGSQITGLEGQFVFGLWSLENGQGMGRLYAFDPMVADSNQPGNQNNSYRELVVASPTNALSNVFIRSFGTGADGELYVLVSAEAGPTGSSGMIYRMTLSEDQNNGTTGSNLISVSDQPITDNRVEVDSIRTAQDGWAVVHLDQNGEPGQIIGRTRVTAGENPDVQIAVDQNQVTSMLWIMLHVDTGAQGVFEFPGPDVPVTENGQIVMDSLTVLDQNQGPDTNTGGGPVPGDDQNALPDQNVGSDQNTGNDVNATPGQGMVVAISDFLFSPSSITVSPGTTVTWTNMDSSPHTVTGTGFDSSVLSTGESYSHRFDQPGSFPYICTIHPSMQGTVIVQG